MQRDGLPIVSTLHDGNASDPLVHRGHLELLRGRMLDPNTTTFVFDSKEQRADDQLEVTPLGGGDGLKFSSCLRNLCRDASLVANNLKT